MRKHAPRAVALGGGTGLPSVLRCLLRLRYETTAVVTVADDGGSSGLLRRELGMSPPGDARNCLVALAEPDNELADVFQYRFPHGEGLAGHALGNLIIAALADIHGGFAEGVEAAARVLGARGRVLPSTLEDVLLHAEDRRGRPLVGQAKIARSAAAVASVALQPEAPAAYPPAVEAIRGAEVVVVGPGSLYTSVVPNLLVPSIAQSIKESGAKVVYVCNVANQRGETHGLDAYDHVRAVSDHGLEGRLDVAIVQEARRLGRCLIGRGPSIEPVDAGADTVRRIRDEGVEVVLADVADEADPRRHSVEKLCAVLKEVL